MSRRLKITLPDTLADQLEELARTTGSTSRSRWWGVTAGGGGRMMS